MPVRDLIISHLEQVAKEQKKTLSPLSDELALLESGLDSLCLAILVARLDDELGCDPFTSSEDMVFPVTLHDFIRSYEDAIR